MDHKEDHHGQDDTEMPGVAEVLLSLKNLDRVELQRTTIGNHLREQDEEVANSISLRRYGLPHTGVLLAEALVSLKNPETPPDSSLLNLKPSPSRRHQMQAETLIKSRPNRAKKRPSDWNEYVHD